MKEIHRKIECLQEHLKVMADLYKAQPGKEWRYKINEIHEELINTIKELK